MFKQLLQAIIAKDNKTIKAFYANNYYKTERFVLKNNGTKADAKDVFQDAFVIVWRKLKNRQFEPNSEKQIEAYLFQVMKHKWYDMLKHSSKYQTNEPDFQANISSETTDIESLLEKENQFKTIAICLQHCKEPCKSILKQFYYQELSYKRMSENLNYDEATLKTMKYRCLNQLRKLVHDKLNADAQ